MLKDYFLYCLQKQDQFTGKIIFYKLKMFAFVPSAIHRFYLEHLPWQKAAIYNPRIFMFLRPVKWVTTISGHIFCCAIIKKMTAFDVNRHFIREAFELKLMRSIFLFRSLRTFSGDFMRQENMDYDLKF